MTKKRMIREVKAAIKENDKYRPFSKGNKGDPKKDYYRGQSDALSWMLELLDVETGTIIWQGKLSDLPKS